MSNQPEMVKPGAGVDVIKAPLFPVKSDLKTGSYKINPDARALVQEALAMGDAMSAEEANAVLEKADNKTFRNAYCSEVIEHMWTPYSELVTGDDMGLYSINFDQEGHSSLTRIPEESLEGMTARQRANVIAKSNEQIMAHFICEDFRRW